MRDKSLRLISTAILAGIFFPAAFAQAPEEVNKRPFYLGGGLGYAIANDFCDPPGSSISGDFGGGSSNDTITAGDCDDKGLSFEGFAGYMFNEYFSAETGFVFANGFGQKLDLRLNGGPSRIIEATVDTKTFFLGAVAYLPFKSNSSFFVKAGMHFWDSELSVLGLSTKTDGTDPYFGLGMQQIYNDNIGIRLEWVRYNADADSAMDIFKGSIIYYF